MPRRLAAMTILAAALAQPAMAAALDDADVATVGSWIQISKPDPMSSVPVRILALPGAHGNLHITCEEQTTRAYMNTDSALPPGFTVIETRVRLDDAEPRKFRWVVNKSGASFGALEAIPFAKSLFDHDRLAIEFPLADGTKQIARFEIARLREAIKPLREACKW